MRIKRLLALTTCVVTAAGVGAGAAFAGEITGNGKLKDVHAASPCAFSGQEDLQWYISDENTPENRRPAGTVVKGEPARVQNWGHVKQASGAPGGAGPAGCNPHVGEG